jgi:hypothetical protein
VPTATTLKITVPKANGTVRSTILITATAKDKSGIARVEFRVDGVLVGVDGGAPYRAKWNSRSVWNGTHHLTVTAINRQNIVTTTEADFTVANSIQFTFPKPGSLGRVSGVVPLTVSNITGGNGSFNVVYRLSKITALGEGTATNHSYSWDTRTVKNTYYRLRARVTDSTGRTTERTTVVKVAH